MSELDEFLAAYDQAAAGRTTAQAAAHAEANDAADAVAAPHSTAAQRAQARADAAERDRLAKLGVRFG